LEDLNYEQAAKIFERIRSSEGVRVFWKIEALRAIYFVFVGNYVELLNSVKRFEQPGSSRLWDLKESESMRNFQRNHMRLLHNFLSAAFTLVDHTRNLVNELYEGQPFRAEYQQKVQDDFIAWDTAVFMKGLRNWMLHRGLVPVRMQARLNGGGESFTYFILLGLEQLKSWGGWEPQAKEYLSGASSDLRLRDVIESYYIRVEWFYQWLGKSM
jgi:hypothetical protein